MNHLATLCCSHESIHPTDCCKAFIVLAQLGYLHGPVYTAIVGGNVVNTVGAYAGLAGMSCRDTFPDAEPGLLEDDGFWVSIKIRYLFINEASIVHERENPVPSKKE